MRKVGVDGSILILSKSRESQDLTQIRYCSRVRAQLSYKLPYCKVLFRHLIVTGHPNFQGCLGGCLKGLARPTAGKALPWQTHPLFPSTVIQ